MEVTRQLADFLVKTRLEDVPTPIVSKGKDLFMDFIAGCLPGTQITPGKIVTEYVRDMGAKPEATVIGAGFKTTAQYAAFANATLDHSPELEAIGLNNCLNPTSTLAVCLALGEKLGLGGREALEGFILGHEVQGRIASASVPAWGKRSDVFKFFHIGCAAAAAKMMKLDSDGVQTTLSLVASQACGLTAQSGTWAHVLDFRVGCRSGIESAIFAAKGISAQKNIIEMPHGFADALCGMENCDLDMMVKDLGKTFRTNSYIKKYPCCFINHTTIDATFALMKEHKITYDQVESVQLDTNAYALSWCQYPNPTTGDEARFSFPHVISSALMDGSVWLETFTDEVVNSKRFKDARAKVKVNTPAEWAKGREGMRFHLTIKMKDGRKFEKEADRDIKEMNSAELLARYRRIVGPHLSPAKTDRTIELLSNMEKLKSVAEVMKIVA